MSLEPTEPQPDQDFAANTLNHVFDLWVGPELERRGIALTREGIRKVVVELEPGRAPRVSINDDAQIVASFREKRAINEGEEVALEDIEGLSDLQPAAVGANSRWFCFARVGAQEYLAYDFRYNRARATALLERAKEFLATARHAGERAISVALDTAHSAAELTVQAQMLTQQNETQSHRERREWLKDWAAHQNSPQQHADVLWNLADLRDEARYGSTSVQLKTGRLTRIFSIVQEMIDQTSARITDRNMNA